MNDILRLNVKRLNRILGNLYDEFKTYEDGDRELPMKWSTMHMYSSSQLAVLTGLKTGLDPELLGIIAALHDIGAIKSKKRENHSQNGGEFVYDIIHTYNIKWRGHLDEITKEETKIIYDSVINHSDKEDVSDNPYVEAMKNIDSLDRYLHGIPTNGDHITRLKNMSKLFEIEVE